MSRALFPKLAACALLSSVLVLQSGCVAVAVGGAAAGTVAYVRGDLQATLDASHERSLRATKRAIERMKYALVSERSDALAGQFIARTALDKKIDVLVTKESDKATKIRIRVGMFGDEQISRALLDAIKAQL